MTVITLPAASVRTLKMSSGISGEAARRSTWTNAAINTAEIASSPIVTAEPHECWVA